MTIDPRLSFDAVPETYARARPGYPAAAFAEVFGYLGGSRETPVSILEIGPGTGQATAALLERDVHVTAVEIGPRLATFLRARFAAEPRLTVVNAAFEEFDPRGRTFDLVFAATAFHWLDPATRVARVAALLAPGGVAATLSTIRIRSDADRGYFDRTFSVYRRWRPDERETIAPTEQEARPADAGEFAASERFGDVRVRTYRWDQRYTTAEYEDLVRSYSSTQTMEPVAREALIADLRAIIDAEYGGYVVRPRVVALTLARRA